MTKDSKETFLLTRVCDHLREHAIGLLQEAWGLQIKPEQ